MNRHPSMLPATLPPGIEWRWAICLDGPCAGQAKEIPSMVGFGRRVRWEQGVYAVGPFFEGTEIRQLVWWDF